MNTRHFVRPTLLATALVALALSTLLACPDNRTAPPPTDGSEADAGEQDVDAGETDDAGESDDTGEAPNSCDDIDCDDDEICYHATCFPACDNDLDCGEDKRCNTGRCARVDCGEMSCDDGHECFRGRCYDECTSHSDCGAGGGITCQDGACVPLDDQCEGLECDQLSCPDGATTTVTGTVNIPSGEHPLPNVTVYVPNDELQPLPEGANCTTCDDLLSGDPLVQNLTDVHGQFELPNFPVAEEVPLVIQTGKWRRKVEISDIEPCTANVLDEDKTRLPRNQSEGNIPRIAIATGTCDNLECLVRDIGLDEDEFTTEKGNGAVNIFHGGGGGSRFESGDSYTDAEDWWIDASKMKKYDIFLDSCECSATISNKPDLARMAFREFLAAGGRAFMSHYQYVWLRDSTHHDLRSIAEWEGQGFGSESTIQVQTDHSGGVEMRDWLAGVNAINDSDQMTISDPRFSVSSINEAFATEWLFYPSEGTSNYFSFNMPLGTEGDEACGRAVFADLHVSSGSSRPFPSGCTDGELDDQEKALVYMLFDLSACIAPDCEPVECEDVKGQCGIHPDKCGGTIECGDCCAGLEQTCDDDDDCCDTLWCDDATGTCTNE